MPTYKVTMFVLGCDPKLTKEVEYVDATDEKTAEEDALWHRDGYGIASTTQMDLDYPSFTKAQVDGIEDEVNKVMGAVISDAFSRESVVDAILSDVISDIEETADWSDLDDDECNLNDIDIAIARVVSERMKADK